MNKSPSSNQATEDSANNNDELDTDQNSSLSAVSMTVAEAVTAVTSYFRWSPKPKRSIDSFNYSDQESRSSESMTDSPTKLPFSKIASTPNIQQEQGQKEELRFRNVSSTLVTDSSNVDVGTSTIRHRHSLNVEIGASQESLNKNEDTKRKISQVETVMWEKDSGISLIEKSQSAKTNNDRLFKPVPTNGKPLEKTPGNQNDRSQSSKVNERMSDSGSRSSMEFQRAHSRERSFEKSLENIMDKCSEKSVDLSLSVESRNGTASDFSKSIDDKGNDSSTKKMDKKKKSSPWYTMWSSSYKSRSEDFRKTFKEVPKDERLIVDYSCALQKEILVQGRMYITQNWVCFYANIFRWETVLAIPCQEIIAITKEKTARVIPNAIQITTEREKYFFTSLGNRDKTYVMLFRIWQNALLKQPMSPKELWQWVHYNYGEELYLTSSDEDYVAPPSFTEEPGKDDMAAVKNDNDDSYDVMPEDEIIMEEDESICQKSLDSVCVGSNDVPTDQSDTTEDSEGEVNCLEHLHFEKQFTEEVFSIPVEKMFELIFTESPFFTSLQDRKGRKDITYSSWSNDGTGHKLRTISYTLPLNYSIGPKSSQTIEKQTCYNYSKVGSMYVVDAECTCLGIPYGDSFMVVNRYCLTRVTKHKSRLRITMEIRYKKSVWGVVKGMIEKNSYQGCLDYFNTLGVHLRQESDKLESNIHQQNQQQPKKKMRKRRIRPAHGHSLQTTQENQKLKLIRNSSVMDKQTRQQTRQGTTPPSPIRNMSYKEDTLSKLNAETLVRVILVVLVLLVIFNAILFYKLWSLEGYTHILYFSSRENNIDHLQNSPKSQEEWTQLLKQQQYLHESEIEKWKDIVSVSITLIDQMKATLSQLKNNLDVRLRHTELYHQHQEN